MIIISNLDSNNIYFLDTLGVSILQLKQQHQLVKIQDQKMN